MDHGSLRIRFADEGAAGRAMAALAPDDPGSMASSLDGCVLVLSTTGPGPLSVLRTLDDAMGCLRATGVP